VKTIGCLLVFFIMCCVILAMHKIQVGEPFWGEQPVEQVKSLKPGQGILDEANNAIVNGMEKRHCGFSEECGPNFKYANWSFDGEGSGYWYVHRTDKHTMSAEEISRVAGFMTNLCVAKNWSGRIEMATPSGDYYYYSFVYHVMNHM